MYASIENTLVPYTGKPWPYRVSGELRLMWACFVYYNYAIMSANNKSGKKYISKLTFSLSVWFGLMPRYK